jgi:VWA domain-containing protein
MPLTVLSFFLALLLLQQTSSSRTVLATVADARNRTIVDVGVDDFVVREGGQPRDVLDARIADYPVVVLVDNSGDARGELEAIRSAAARFITRVGGRPIALGTISDPPTMLTTFDDDRATVTDKLKALTTNTSSSSMALQSVAAAARAIQAVGTRFSAIVVISANAVDATKAAPGELLTTVLESGAIVHVVAERSFFNRGAAGLPGQYSDILRSLADQTHGQFTTIYSNASFQVALDHLADRLAGEMLIEYVVPSGAPPTADVKLGVRLPGAHVRGFGVR